MSKVALQRVLQRKKVNTTTQYNILLAAALTNVVLTTLERRRGSKTNLAKRSSTRSQSAYYIIYNQVYKQSICDRKGCHCDTTLRQAWLTDMARKPQCAFEMSMFMCPAVHMSTRSLLRPSSTHEPSDPPFWVVIKNF